MTGWWVATIEPHRHRGHHPCQGLGFKASWQPALLSLSLAVLGGIQRSCLAFSRSGGSTFLLLRPYPGWSQVSGAQGEGLVGSQAGACRAWGEPTGGGELAPPGEKGRAEAASGLGTAVFHQGEGEIVTLGDTITAIFRSKKMEGGDQGINTSNRKGRFEIN